mgnify:CR=1 FL=1
MRTHETKYSNYQRYIYLQPLPKINGDTVIGLFRKGIKIQYKGGVIGEVTIRCPMLSGFGNVWRYPVYEITDDYIVIDKGRKILIKRGYYTVSRPAEGLPRDFMLIDIYAKKPPVLKGDTIMVEPYHPEAIAALSSVNENKKLLDVIDELIKKYNERLDQMKDEVINAWTSVLEDIHEMVLKVRKDIRGTFQELVRQELEYSKTMGERLKERYRVYTTRELTNLATSFLSLVDQISTVLSSRLGIPREEIADTIIREPSKILEYANYIRLMQRPKLGIESARPSGKEREAKGEVKEAGGKVKEGE